MPVSVITHVYLANLSEWKQSIMGSKKLRAQKKV